MGYRRDNSPATVKNGRVMARIKLVYIGGGSTRAAGTMASLISRAAAFQGSEVVLVDPDAEHLALVTELARKMARAQGADLDITSSPNRRSALEGADTVLTSFRPGGFEARYLDESIPLKHGIVGQETQGPGGFFMALRSVHLIREIVDDMRQACPGAWLFNYTNPVNIVSQAVVRHGWDRVVSLCEGPIIFPREVAHAAGLDPDKLEAVMIGLNHGCWSVRHSYDGQDAIPYFREAYERKRQDAPRGRPLRLLQLVSAFDSLPASYMEYYYFRDEVVAETRARGTTRAQDILSRVPDYWRHYAEQLGSENPQLDPKRSRGGIHELELAFDVMDAVFNDRKQVWPVNVVNHGALPDFPDDLVVEARGLVGRSGITALAEGHLPAQVRGLIKMLGEYQWLSAAAALDGNRHSAVQALASHPLVPTLELAERLYDEMAAAHAAHLPARLLA
jgi:6-phospho-beta-glucosidase